MIVGDSHFLRSNRQVKKPNRFNYSSFETLQIEFKPLAFSTEFTMASTTKLVTVVGATGAQGGSVVKSLLQNKGLFSIRAVTRNPDSESAQTLRNSGVEIVKGDGLNKEDMLAAFKGAWAVYVNTRSNDPAFRTPNGPSEVDCGRIIVEAANEVGVKHFLYSSGSPVSELTNGGLTLPMMDDKYKIEQLARKSPNIGTVTAINAGWYFENFADPGYAEIMGGFPYSADSDGYLTLNLPLVGGEESAPFIAMEEDYGDLVHGVLLEPEKWAGKLIQATSELSSFLKMTEIFEKVTGKKTRFVAYSSWKDFPTYDMPDLEELRAMFDYTQRVGGGYFSGLKFDTETAKQLKEAVQRSVTGTTGGKSLMTLEEFFVKKFAQT